MKEKNRGRRRRVSRRNEERPAEKNPDGRGPEDHPRKELARARNLQKPRESYQARGPALVLEDMLTDIFKSTATPNLLLARVSIRTTSARYSEFIGSCAEV